MTSNASDARSRAMEGFAFAFDQPTHSQEHCDLRETGWVVGTDVTIRYWLGRLLQRNFYRVPDEGLKDALQEYFAANGGVKGACAARDMQTWGALSTVLRHSVELNEGLRPTANTRLVGAINAVLKDPELSNFQVAAKANTTERQVARMSDVFLIRKHWKLETEKLRAEGKSAS